MSQDVDTATQLTIQEQSQKRDIYLWTHIEELLNVKGHNLYLDCVGNHVAAGSYTLAFALQR